MKKYLISLSLLILIFPVFANFLQPGDKKQYDKELSALKGSAFVKRALQIAHNELNNQNTEDALYFYKKAYNFSLNNLSPQGTAVIGYEIVGKIASTSGDSKLNEYGVELLESCTNALTDRNMLGTSYEYAGMLMPKVSEKNKKKLTNIQQKTRYAYDDKNEKLEKQRIQEELEKKLIKEKEDSLALALTKSEVINLSENVNDLQNTTSVLSERMNQNEEVIKNMSRDNLIKETLLEKNKRYIDSLFFEKTLDSIILETNNFELERAQASLDLQKSKKNLYLALSSILLLASLLIFFVFYSTKKKNALLKEKNYQIQIERERSEELLLNILPKEVAEELKETGKVKAQQFDESTIVFTDFVNFSSISQKLSPQELVSALDYCFGEFDRIIEKFDVEKIKTIGDAYMCIAGVPRFNNNHAELAIETSLEFLRFIKTWNNQRVKNHQPEFNIRIGIHTGPVCAGVVGSKKFIFDVWGDSVNIAARMEANALPNTINISESTHQKVAEKYKLTPRGAVATKNMGELNMYIISL